MMYVPMEISVAQGYLPPSALAAGLFRESSIYSIRKVIFTF